MSASAEDIANTASGFIEEEGGWSGFIQNTILGGIVFQVYAQVVEGISSFGDVLLAPPRALGLGLAQVVEVVFEGLGEVFVAGTEASVRSFADGTAALLGPLAQPAAKGTILATLAIFIWGINRLDISPFSFIRSLRG